MKDAPNVMAAVVQASPAFFSSDTAIDKISDLVIRAKSNGAELVVFPEAYVGGYPWGLAFGTAVGGRSDSGRRVWQRYWDTAVEVPGMATKRMGEIARGAGVYLEETE